MAALNDTDAAPVVSEDDIRAYFEAQRAEHDARWAEMEKRAEQHAPKADTA